MVAALTAGTVAAPFTLWPGALAMAWLPRVRTASTPVALRMLPPCNATPEASTPIPSGSASVALVT